MEKATFGAGCFWGIQAVFDTLKGVLSTTVGYMGGRHRNPTYDDVCSNKTGHAEVVQITFDPEIIMYEELLTTFWKIHDPTLLNRQGPDIGTQYRSIIFYHSEEQKRKAIASKNDLQRSRRYKDPIVTQIAPIEKFYRAEEYHQHYLKKQNIKKRNKGQNDPK
jgi:peptide-methionine (S)-S-oxide reductase